METVAEHYARMNRTGNPCSYSGDRGHWLIVLGQHRDSDILEQSNFAACLARLESIDADSVAVESAGHWAVGWVETILVDPGAPDVVTEAETILAELEDYPVLDDDDLSQREWDTIQEAWKFYGADDYLRALEGRYGLDLWELPAERLWELFSESGADYHVEGQGACFDVKSAAAEISLADLLGAPVVVLNHAHGFAAMVTDAEDWARRTLEYDPPALEWALDRMDALETFLTAENHVLAEPAIYRGL